MTRSEAAAVSLQKAWRCKFRFLTTLKLVKFYSALRAHVEALDYAAVMVSLSEKNNIKIAKKCLQRVNILTSIRHGSDEIQPVNAKEFLVSLMIRYHPAHIFESIGHLENQLIEATAPLLMVFDEILRIIQSTGSFQSVSGEVTKEFPALLKMYFKRFNEWKIADINKMKFKIKRSIVSLHQATHEADRIVPELLVGVYDQIRYLRNKFEQVASADEVNEFYEQLERDDVSMYAPSSGELESEQIVHELLLDPTYVHLRSSDSEVFSEPFWESLVNDLCQSPPAYTLMIKVLQVIVNGLGIMSQKDITQVLNINRIRAQAVMGTYVWENCTLLVTTIFEYIQHVECSDQTKIQWDTLFAEMQTTVDRQRVFGKVLRFLLDCVDELRVDIGNKRLRLVEPAIRIHGFDYERGKFQDKINNGALTLECTAKWLRTCIIQGVQTRTLDLDVLVRGISGEAFARVHAAAMVSFLMTDVEQFPETLRMDITRLQGLRCDFKSAISATALMATASYTISATKNPVDLVVLEEIKVLLAQENLVLGDVRTALLKTSLSEKDQTTLVQALLQCTSQTDAVWGLMSTRIRILCLQIIQGDTNLTIVHAAQSVVPRVEQIASKLSALIKLNYTVHAATYNTLMRQTAEELLRED